MPRIDCVGQNSEGSQDVVGGEASHEVGQWREEESNLHCFFRHLG